MTRSTVKTEINDVLKSALVSARQKKYNKNVLRGKDAGRQLCPLCFSNLNIQDNYIDVYGLMKDINVFIKKQWFIFGICYNYVSRSTME